MRLIACYFPPAAAGMFPDHWSRMAAVLAHSATLHSPSLEICIKRLDPARLLPGRGDAIAANTWKLEHWAAAVEAAAEDELLVLMDVDTFILRDITCAFNRSFDVAYTVRDPIGPPSKLPFNAGVVFVRATHRARAFFAAWREENRAMAADSGYHAPWFRKYGGINQAALGKLLEDGLAAELGLVLEALPCSEWNCEDSTWARFDPLVTRVVHVKSALRRDVFNLSPAALHLRHITRMWRDLERGALRAGRARA